MSFALPPRSTLPLARREVPAVDVRQLRKEFKRRVHTDGRFARKRSMLALNDVTFSVVRGECVAILGRNGSGKSTLVRLLSTLLLQDGGSARIFKRMSAAENLAYAARFYGLTHRETARQIPEILTRVGFPPERRNEPMENLSRGMQQKVALARALLTSPVLLLLDEPTTGLDPRSKLEVQQFIKSVRAEHDATIVLCTHDLVEAQALADRVGILERGELLCLEPVGALLRRYGVSTLEQAFFAATGAVFDAEDEDEREVFA
jgi:ABC-2 type transport system ATP-binding protein